MSCADSVVVVVRSSNFLLGLPEFDEVASADLKNFFILSMSESLFLLFPPTFQLIHMLSDMVEIHKLGLHYFMYTK